MIEIYCKYCGSLEVIKFIQVFKDGTKHLYVKCGLCRKQFYASKEFITPDIGIELSPKQKNKIERLKQIMFTELEK